MARRRRFNPNNPAHQRIAEYYNKNLLQKTKIEMAADLGVSPALFSIATSHLPSKSQFLEPIVLEETRKGVGLKALAARFGCSTVQIWRIAQRARIRDKARRQQDARNRNQ